MLTTFESVGSAREEAVELDPRVPTAFLSAPPGPSLRFSLTASCSGDEYFHSGWLKDFYDSSHYALRRLRDLGFPATLPASPSLPKLDSDLKLGKTILIRRAQQCLRKADLSVICLRLLLTWFCYGCLFVVCLLLVCLFVF